MKKIYLIGKVIGVHPTESIAEFSAAKAQLKAQGHEVLWPVEVHHKFGESYWQKEFSKYLEKMMEADVVYVLPSTQSCEIAQTEVSIAKFKDKVIHYELENILAYEPVDDLHCKKQEHA